MRFVSMLAALAALWIQPAQAVTFGISGVATGTVSGSIACDIGFCTTSAPFTKVFNIPVFDPIQIGDIFTFEVGTHSYSERYTGSFKELGNGQFQGLQINYSRFNLACLDRLGIPDCDYSASTNNFTVSQLDPAPVPEPAIWAMMLLGFGVIGGAMRRRPQVALAVSL